MDVDEFRREIEVCTDAIWMHEPPDLRRLRLGIVDSGAGSQGQFFTTLVYVQSEVRGLALNACQALLVCAREESFGLDHLKLAAKAHLSGRTGLLNYLGLHELGGLYGKFLRHLDELDSKDAFVSLLQALKTYGARTHMWTLYAFPWHVGLPMRQLAETDVGALQSELEHGRWQQISYAGR